MWANLSWSIGGLASSFAWSQDPTPRRNGVVTRKKNVGKLPSCKQMCQWVVWKHRCVFPVEAQAGCGHLRDVLHVTDTFHVSACFSCAANAIHEIRAHALSHTRDSPGSEPNIYIHIITLLCVIPTVAYILKIPETYSSILSGTLSDMHSDKLSNIFSDILSHFLPGILRHVIWQNMFFYYSLPGILSFYLIYIYMLIPIWHSLWHSIWHKGWGHRGPEKARQRFGSVEAHGAPKVAVEFWSARAELARSMKARLQNTT